MVKVSTKEFRRKAAITPRKIPKQHGAHRQLDGQRQALCYNIRNRAAEADRNPQVAFGHVDHIASKLDKNIIVQAVAFSKFFTFLFRGFFTQHHHTGVAGDSAHDHKSDQHDTD